MLTALGNLVLPEEETDLALFHGAGRLRPTARYKLNAGSGRRSQAFGLQPDYRAGRRASVSCLQHL